MEIIGNAVTSPDTTLIYRPLRTKPYTIRHKIGSVRLQVLLISSSVENRVLSTNRKGGLSNVIVPFAGNPRVSAESDIEEKLCYKSSVSASNVDITFG